MSGKIFINYRREDERATAARIRDRLAANFGDRNVFTDLERSSGAPCDNTDRGGHHKCVQVTPARD